MSPAMNSTYRKRDVRPPTRSMPYAAIGTMSTSITTVPTVMISVFSTASGNAVCWKSAT
ncbi:hypothetical protein D3C73_1593860 [compost metagenome]